MERSSRKGRGGGVGDGAGGGGETGAAVVVHDDQGRAEEAGQQQGAEGACGQEQTGGVGEKALDGVNRVHRLTSLVLS